ncbi:uncharacterized protein LOC114522479 [Dendronephthya gigantea]|uniref:uncharacterized protein LOC114522479 n=1 Tax=Dendronephthya gigantea TaxID=151771 RepID=UPI00106A39ED|nr:uncharacterized protein LOC114522479 [Dendronephthya gigantea]
MKFFCICVLTVITVVLCQVPFHDNMSKVTLCPDCTKFSSVNIKSNFSNFATILKIENTPTFLVGASDALLLINLNGDLIRQTTIKSKENDYKLCLRQNSDSCANIITMIIPLGEAGLVLACGTNAEIKYYCWEVNGTNIIGTPQEKTFYTAAEDVRYVVSGSSIFISSETKYHSRQNGKLKRVNLDEENGRPDLELTIIDIDPVFISLYEFGNYIYYLFTDLSEEAVEEKTRITYSRIGRLCKYDRGGESHTPSRNFFQTFSKVRLLCFTTTSQEKFHYNNLEFTSVVTGEDGEVYIYGLFRAARPADKMFAVCRYSLSNIEKAFESGRYYDTRSSQKAVFVADSGDPRQKTCNSSLDTKAVRRSYFQTNIQSRQLHVAVVEPDGGRPVATRNHNTKIMKMLVDSDTIANTSYEIVRLFYSNLMHEIFVPKNFFNDKDVKTYLSVRKISEQPLHVADVVNMKFSGVKPSVSPKASSTPRPTTIEATTPQNTSPTPILTDPVSSATPSSGNSTRIPVQPNNTSPTNLTTTKSLLRRRFFAPPMSDSSSKPKPPSRSTGFMNYPGQKTVIVAADEALLFVPVASCGAHTSCRDCVEAANPYCGWDNGKCVQLNSSKKKSTIIQDIKNGDYEKVCPSVAASCKVVQTNKLIPKAEIILQCSASGVPEPTILFWTKDGKRLPGNSSELKISNYTLKTAGTYECHVRNHLSSQSCSVKIPGSPPKIQCKVTKDFKLACSASGYPHPKLVTQTKNNQSEGSVVKIEKDESQIVAYNAFGVKSSGIYKIITKTFEFAIKDVTWSDDLLDTGSQAYQDLRGRVLNGLKELYKGSNLFQKAKIIFRKGSVIAITEVSGLKTPTSDESDLTRPLEDAIQGKTKLGDLNVSKPVPTQKPTTPGMSDQQSTNAPPSAPRTPGSRNSSTGKQTRLPTTLPKTRLPSTRLPTSRLPTSRLPTSRLTTRTQIISSRQGLVTKQPVAQTSPSSGVPIWLLILLLIVIGLIVFVSGYFCGRKGIPWSKLSRRFRRRDTNNSPESAEDCDNGERMTRMSRSEKARESERMLLRKDENDGKRQKSPAKNNHDLTNNVSKDGSVEIKKHYSSEEESRPLSGQSSC